MRSRMVMSSLMILQTCGTENAPALAAPCSSQKHVICIAPPAAGGADRRAGQVAGEQVLLLEVFRFLMDGDDSLNNPGCSPN